MKPVTTDLVVLGAGPGGYAAAFYAADKGKKVILVDREKRLGGVCLNQGCIPSKALLHVAKLIHEVENAKSWGIDYAAPNLRLEALRSWKEGVVNRLNQGIEQLAKQRKVQVLRGRGRFEDSKTLRVETEDGSKIIRYEKGIVATGSRPALPAAFDSGNPGIMTSAAALRLEEIPKSLLVVGGGYIGLELGTVYAALGSRVALVEALPNLLTGVDPDLVQPVRQFAARRFHSVRLQTKVTAMKAQKNQIQVLLEEDGKKIEESYERVLVAVGRTPNSDGLGLEHTKVKTDEKGFVRVNEKQQTADPALYAIGDIAGGALLAHKAVKEARVAVEAMTGQKGRFKRTVIPAVVFTDPEIAWCGLTEGQAKEKGIAVETVKFRWAASGRALTLDRPDGLTKLLVEPGTERILGVGITGSGAGELIGEGALAVEMGAKARDLASTVHPHPTLSETLMECADLFYGHATHAAPRKKN